MAALPENYDWSNVKALLTQAMYDFPDMKQDIEKIIAQILSLEKREANTKETNVALTLAMPVPTAPAAVKKEIGTRVDDKQEGGKSLIRQIRDASDFYDWFEDDKIKVFVGKSEVVFKCSTGDGPNGLGYSREAMPTLEITGIIFKKDIGRENELKCLLVGFETLARDQKRVVAFADAREGWLQKYLKSHGYLQHGENEYFYIKT